MAQALKEMYNAQFLADFSAIVQRGFSTFNEKQFTSAVLDEHWHGRELKDRMHHITVCLREELPTSYMDALAVMCKIAPQCVGFPYMFFSDFVETYGTSPEHEQRSLQALELFTQFSSAEFAIRPFIRQSTDRTMAQMLAWTAHESEHVRRLASEGCRPRLPWAGALPDFKRDPAPILPILEALKADESEYVRRSVANNLNDIAKDHPRLVLDIAERWKGTNPHTDWIIRHGCRTLFKKGNAEALALVGVKASNDVRVEHFRAENPRLCIGETLTYFFDLLVDEIPEVPESQDVERLVRIDVAVDYVKSNGSTSRKVFKVLEKPCFAGKQTLRRTLRFQDFTTRKHYAGEHRLTLVVNGVESASIVVLLSKVL